MDQFESCNHTSRRAICRECFDRIIRETDERARAEEREACALIASTHGLAWGENRSTQIDVHSSTIPQIEIAKAIRARSGRGGGG